MTDKPTLVAFRKRPQPDATLIKLTEEMHEQAKAGELRALLSVSYLASGDRITLAAGDYDPYHAYGVLCELAQETLSEASGDDCD